VNDFVWFIVAGLGGGILFWAIQQYIAKRREAMLKSTTVTNFEKKAVQALVDKGILTQEIANKVSESIEKTATQVENYDTTKLKEGLTSLTDKVKWAKAFVGEFNLRTILIRLSLIMVLIGAIYGYGWYKGKQGIRPVLDLHGKEEWIQLNEHYLHVLPDGSMETVDKDKKTVLKKITIKDVENMKKALRPYGFILEPIAVVGGSLGDTGGKMDAGAGVSFFKWYKSKAEAFLAYTGAYLGISYSVTDHSGAGLAIGKGWKGDNRAMLYYKFRF
jgi:hypothetical protein